MTTQTGGGEVPPFHLQPVLSNLYYAKDLLDLSASDPPAQAQSSNLLASASAIATAAGRRAAAVASSATSSTPPKPGVGPGNGHRSANLSPDRGVPAEKKEINCVEGYGQNLYIGRSDGVVEWWVIDGTSGNIQSDGWVLRHKHTLFPRRPVSKIILLPRVSKVLVLSDGTLHALVLPSLEPLPPTTIQPLRGVVTVVLDDDQLDWAGPGGEEKGADMTVVVVRRKGMGWYRLGTRMSLHKEIPLPSSPSSAALYSNYLCAAIPSTNTYSIIDLSDASLTEVLPVSQIDASVLDFEPNPNVVVIPGENEFLVTSYTGAGTMGVFLNGQGDPVRGTMEWPDHPLSIAIDSGFIIALLRNQSIVIHALLDLEKPVQTIALEIGYFALTYSPYGVSIRDIIRDERMQTVRIVLLGGRLKPKEHIPVAIKSPVIRSPESEEVEMATRLSPDETEEPPSGSGLTPPSSPPTFKRQPITPARGSSLLQATAPTFRGPFSTAVAETLVIGPNGFQSLSPTPTLLRLEKLCSEGLMDEATVLVDEERRKGRRGEVDADKTTHQATLRLLHLYLACHLLTRGVFDKAGDYFLKGKVDPRVVVRIFPALRGKVIGSAEEVEVFQGIKQVLEDMPPIEEIVRQAQDPDEARRVAHTMLTDFLRKTRTSRRKGGGSRGVDSRKIDIVIDTVLAKLLAEDGVTHELLALLAGSNDCVLSELEPFLVKRPYVLATVMRQQGRTDRVLELLQEIADGEPDPLCPDPVGEFAQTLEDIKEPDSLKRHILWLAGKNADKALQILIRQNTKSGVKFDDGALITELREIDIDTADRYLEHVVIAKRSPNKALHQDLLNHLLDRAESEIKDDGVKYHLEELDAEYRLSSDPQPFCVFLADVAPSTPVKEVRLKLMLFLQGSPFYDLQAAATRLEKNPQLKPELAVVLGRLGRHRPALQLLARDIGDSISAQAYCTQGGEIIPPRVARTVAAHVPELAEWASLGEVGRRRRGTVDAKLQESLVMELLGVYMRDGASTAKQTAALLNAQSVHLDVLEVLALVPPEWPLDVVSSFFKRSLRRQLHDKATGEIIKAISAGQNIETSEEHLEAIARIPPAIMAKPAPGGEGGSTVISPSGLSQPDEGSIPEKEYTSFDEKREVVQAVDEGFFSSGEVDKELKDIHIGPKSETEKEAKVVTAVTSTSPQERGRIS